MLGRNRGVIWLWLSAGIIATDQLSKWLVETQMEYAQRIAVLPVFDFTRRHNSGAAFSFLAEEDGWQRWMFSGVALGVSVAIIAWMFRMDAANKRLNVALALILGGAIGNLIDRLHHGHVVDFLLFYWEPYAFPAFNVADMAITCGVILMLFDSWKASAK